MKFLHSIYLLFFLSIANFSFGQYDWSKLLMAEDFIYKNKMDSALFYLNKMKRDNYVEALSRIADSKYSNHDLWMFIQASLKSNLVDEKKKVKFIEDKIIQPQSRAEIEIDYVRVRSEEHIFLMNSNRLEKASVILNSLKKYVSIFENINSVEMKYAQYYINHSEIIFHIIKREIEEGEKLCD